MIDNVGKMKNKTYEGEGGVYLQREDMLQ